MSMNVAMISMRAPFPYSGVLSGAAAARCGPAHYLLSLRERPELRRGDDRAQHEHDRRSEQCERVVAERVENPSRAELAERGTRKKDRVDRAVDRAVRAHAEVTRDEVADQIDFGAHRETEQKSGDGGE